MFYKEPMKLKGQRVWGLGDQKDRNTAQEEILTTSFWSTATKTRVELMECAGMNGQRTLLPGALK
jgi:hypothetical protein